MLHVSSQPTLPPGEVKRGLGTSLLPRWSTVSHCLEPEKAQGENVTFLVHLQLLDLFSSESLIVKTVINMLYLVLNTGYTDSVCEHTELYHNIKWPWWMWK